jgi:hypothetical protein
VLLVVRYLFYRFEENSKIQVDSTLLFMLIFKQAMCKIPDKELNNS